MKRLLMQWLRKDTKPRWLKYLFWFCAESFDVSKNLSSNTNTETNTRKGLLNHRFMDVQQPFIISLWSFRFAGSLKRKVLMRRVL